MVNPEIFEWIFFFSGVHLIIDLYQPQLKVIETIFDLLGGLLFFVNDPHFKWSDVR
jgi:hypothetical protein